tara:strand:- start:193 stop:387 length:195 start_codon:yes stop_codon:yes gene_type:complete
MIKVEGYSNLYRDEKTGAIVNCDSITYNQYVNSLDIKEFKNEELNNMKKDIEEIKNLLKDFLSK